MSVLIGHRLANRYDIQSLIGRGGMGIVNRSYDSMLQRAVAVKVLPLQMTIDPLFVQRFQQEAIVAANLRHRDIKPSNIMIGANGRVTLMDFGLVRAGEGSGLTRSNVVMGMPGYMVPEQALGQPVEWRADIYALGVVIFKCLTGVVPFVRTTPMAVAVAHAYEPPLPPRSLRPDLPKPVEAVAMKA